MAERSKKCPNCGSTDTRFREKRSDCFCDACDHRWEAPPPGLGEETITPLRIFLSYGHDKHAADALQIKAGSRRAWGTMCGSTWSDCREGRDWEQYIE